MPTELRPNQPTNIGLSDALSRLGSPNERLPSLTDLVPVIVMGDVSRSLTSEVVEARRFSAVFRNAVAGNFVGCQLTAQAPGGLVVERLFLSTTNPGGALAGFPFVTLVRGPTGIVGGGALVGLEAGGVPTVSTLQGLSEIARPNPAASESIQVACQNLTTVAPIVGPNDRFWCAIDLRLYLPASWVLILYAEVGQVFEAQLEWRELADVQGTAG